VNAVILAAGAGTRLNGSQNVIPKCLATPGGVSLIERQTHALRRAGIDEITVVVGFQADAVRAACPAGTRFVENASFERTNSLYSLWLARPFLGTGFVVLNCDVLFDPRLLCDLVEARHEDALLVSYPCDGDPPFGDEEMKVRIRRGRVVDIAKTLSGDQTDAENVGIAKFGPLGAARLVRIMDHLIAADAVEEWAPRGFKEFASTNALYAIGTRGLPWIEIDTPADYRRAVLEVIPAIDGTQVSPARRRPCEDRTNVRTIPQPS
jgi:L-glutamine-phosphate cytidylyltransferase